MSLTQADYEAFTYYVAKFGMSNALSFSEFESVHNAMLFDGPDNALNAAYGANCDILAGVSPERAVRLNVERNKSV